MVFLVFKYFFADCELGANFFSGKNNRGKAVFLLFVNTARSLSHNNTTPSLSHNSLMDYQLFLLIFFSYKMLKTYASAVIS